MDTCRKTDAIVSIDAKKGRVRDYMTVRKQTLNRILTRCQKEHQ